MPVVRGTVQKGGLHFDVRLRLYLHADKLKPAFKVLSAGIGIFRLNYWDTPFPFLLTVGL